MRWLFTPVFRIPHSAFRICHLTTLYDCNHFLDLRIGHFRENGERHATVGDIFGNRKRYDISIIFSEHLLTMERDRVIDGRGDPGVRQRLHDFIPAVGQNGVLVINMDPLAILVRRDDLRILQERVIKTGDPSPPGIVIPRSASA